MSVEMLDSLDPFAGGRKDRVRADADFEAAYRGMFLAAMRPALRLLGNRSAAEDVAAEALTRAYAQWPRVREYDNPEAWVRRVASNLALDVLRRHPPAQDAERPVGFEDASSLRVALAASLAVLPPRQRDAVVLRYLRGLTDVEVGASMGIAPSSVRTHLQRGLACLRTRLASEPEERGLPTASPAPRFGAVSPRPKPTPKAGPYRA